MSFFLRFNTIKRTLLAQIASVGVSHRVQQQQRGRQIESKFLIIFYCAWLETERRNLIYLLAAAGDLFVVGCWPQQQQFQILESHPLRIPLCECDFVQFYSLPVPAAHYKKAKLVK